MEWVTFADGDRFVTIPLGLPLQVKKKGEWRRKPPRIRTGLNLAAVNRVLQEAYLPRIREMLNTNTLLLDRLGGRG